MTKPTIDELRRDLAAYDKGIELHERAAADLLAQVGKLRQARDQAMSLAYAEHRAAEDRTRAAPSMSAVDGALIRDNRPGRAPMASTFFFFDDYAGPQRGAVARLEKEMSQAWADQRHIDGRLAALRAARAETLRALQAAELAAAEPEPEPAKKKKRGIFT